MAPEVAGVLSLAVTWTSQDRQHGREWLCNGGQRSPNHRARKLHQQTPATVISMTSALHPKDNQELPTDLPKHAATTPMYLPTGERPGRQTGLSSSRGVRLIPRRLAARAPWERASTHSSIVQSPLSSWSKTNHSAHERVAQSSGMGVCLCPGPVRAQSRAARLNAEWV